MAQRRLGAKYMVNAEVPSGGFLWCKKMHSPMEKLRLEVGPMTQTRLVVVEASEETFLARDFGGTSHKVMNQLVGLRENYRKP